MGAVIFLHFFPRVFVILVLGVGWVPHGQSDFQIQALEGAPVLTNGLDQRLPFLSRSKATSTPYTLERVCNPLPRGRRSGYPYFTDGNTEGNLTCPRSHSKEVSELGLWGGAFMLEPMVSLSPRFPAACKGQ